VKCERQTEGLARETRLNKAHNWDKSSGCRHTNCSKYRHAARWP